MSRTLTGAIPRFSRFFISTALALGLIAVAGSAAAGDFMPRLGNYFNTDEPGWGLDVQLADPERFGADNLIFVIWFTYRADGTPIWYLAVGELEGTSWSGTLDVFTWSRQTLEASNETIGTIALEWSSETDATFSWDLDGLAGKGPVIGEREVSLAEFAAGPTRIDYSGHHFQPNTSGWGMSILTLGTASVGTMYFYDGDGQPTWIQGVDADSDLVLELDAQYFTGTDLCPACLSQAAKGSGSFESVHLTDVFVSYHRRLLEEPERIDDVELFFGLAYLFTDVNDETPLGAQPFAFAPQAIATQPLPGGGAYSTLMPLTPVPLTLSDDELSDVLALDELEISLGINITPGFPPNCAIQATDTLELELGPDEYGLLLRGGSEVFFVDELGITWNIPTRVAVFKPGDETLSIMVQGGVDQGLANSFHLQWLSGPVALFLDDPAEFVMNQVVSARVNGIFTIPPRIFSSLYSGRTEEACGVATSQ